MLIHKGFRFRIYPTEAQIARLSAWESSLRFLWNLANEQRLIGLSRCGKDRRYPTAFDQHKELTDLRAELPWLADVPRDVCEALLVDLDVAWQRCFKKLGRKPAWKRKGLDVVSCREAHAKMWRLDGSTLRFPKLGNIRTVVHRPLEGKPKSCTIRRDGDQWFASILCEIEVPDQAPRTDPVVAIDRGVTNLLADSDGRLVPNPAHLERALKRLAHAQRTVSRRKKGSKNRAKTVARVNRIHRKVRRQREHFLHELSAAYAKSHGVVVVERLNVQGMVKGRSLSRRIASAGWGMFVNMLGYKLQRSGGTLIEVPAAYSSQTCSACGVVDAASRNGERFCCTGCGYVDHADLNAAKNLKARANRSCKPVEATGSSSGQRSRKRVQLRTLRRLPERTIVT